MNDRKEIIENGERSARSASGAPENGKRRFNIIDILIIIAVIALIAAVAVRYDFAGNVTTRTETAKAEISFIISNVRKTSSDYLIEGDTVVWTATGMTIGTLKSIRSATRSGTLSGPTERSPSSTITTAAIFPV